MLQKARRNCRDPERGGQVTQERFVELLSQRMGDVRAPTSATLSNWERGRSRPGGHDRTLLYAIVGVLLHCEGLGSLADANVLLTRGGYAPLTQAEAQPYQDVMPTLAAAGEHTSNQALPTTIHRTADAIADMLDARQTRVVKAHLAQGNGRVTRSDV